MLTYLRRMFWLALFGGAGYGAWTIWQRQNSDAPAAPPTWPPIDTTPPPVPNDTPAAPVTAAPVSTFAAVSNEPAEEPAAAPGATGDRRWVDPVDGECPPGYPIKANDNSGIFHVPGGRFYNRTVPERCYADADDALADGYRAAKA